MPDSDAHRQAGAFIPAKIFADTSEASQGRFQPGGAAGADYETTSTGNTGDSDSGGPSGL